MSLGERLARIEADSIPAAVTERTKLSVLDLIGVGLAAHQRGLGVEGSAWAAEQGGSGGRLIGGKAGVAVAPAAAALANGMLCHALDFDDTHPESMSHTSTVVLPAALAVGQALGASGRDLLTALVVGTEVTARIGMVAPGAFHAKGFHPTSVCGVFGAVAGVATMRGFDAATTDRALGLAGSTSSGLWAFLEEGTATKPFHAGWAAHAGVVTASLADLGAAGPAGVLTNRFGTFDALLGIDAEEAVAAQLGDLGERWETLAVSIKPYPACHLVHAALQGGRSLLDQGATAETVTSIEAEVPETAIEIVLEPRVRKVRPSTPYEARFSLQYSLAAMLVEGSVGLDTYEPTAIADERVLGFADRIEATVGERGSERGPFFTSLMATLADGSSLRADVPHPSGTPGHPLDREAVLAKFHANADPVLGVARAEELAATALTLDELPAGQLDRLTPDPMETD